MARPDHPAAHQAVDDSDACDGRDPARLRRLVWAAQLGDREARERVVATHIDLVRAMASRYRSFGLPYDDLVQEGSIGLLEAIDGFDARRSSDFERFARFRVRRAIHRALTQQSRLVRLPKHVVERRRAIDRAAATLVVATGRAATTDELAAVTGLSPAAIHDARAAEVDLVSLDEPVLPDGSTLAAVIADRAATDPQQDLLEREQIEELRSGVDALPSRQRTLVVRHWGLDGKPTTTHDLATELHLSSGRARTIANDALYVLRAALDPGPGRTTLRPPSTAPLRRPDRHASPARFDHRPSCVPRRAGALPGGCVEDGRVPPPSIATVTGTPEASRIRSPQWLSSSGSPSTSS